MGGPVRPDPDTFAFGAAMVAAGYFDTPRAVLDYFDQPLSWAPEFELWAACGRPGEPQDAGWDWFVRRLEVIA
jgi:hypothetical protein